MKFKHVIQMFLFALAIVCGASMESTTNAIQQGGNNIVFLPTIFNNYEPFSPPDPAAGEIELFSQNPSGNFQQIDYFGETIEVEVEGNLAVFQGDMILGDIDTLAQKSLLSIDNDSPAQTALEFRWLNNSIPVEIPTSIDPITRARIEEGIALVEDVTNLEFPLRTTEADYVTFQFGEGCSSRVGRQGGAQSITLATAPYFCSAGTIAHELLHAAGLYHMHSRTDRDDFVTIIEDNIVPDYLHNFEKASSRSDVFDVGVYDYCSIMHYGARAFSQNGLYTIVPHSSSAFSCMGQRFRLSHVDIHAVNTLYPALSVSDLVAVWEHDLNEDGNNHLTMRQGLGNDATANEGVNNFAIGDDHSEPDIAGSANGDYVVVWQGGTEGVFYRIYYQIYSANGDIRRAEYVVTPSFNGFHTKPVVAMAANGDFAIAWEDDPDGNGNANIMVQGFYADGSTKFAPVKANSSSGGDHRRPDIAMKPNGEIIVVWQDDRDGNGADEIVRMRFRPDGTPFGDNNWINTDFTGNQRFPSIAINLDGYYVIAWQDARSSADGIDIYARGFFQRDMDTASNIPGETFDERKMNYYTGGLQLKPDVGIADSGDFVVTWQDDLDENGFYEIVARRFNNDGTPKYREVWINMDSRGQQFNPQVAMNGSGDFVIIWEDERTGADEYDIIARGYYADGRSYFSEVIINKTQTGIQTKPVIILR